MPQDMSVILANALPIVAMIAVFYLVLYRPQKKKEKTTADMRKSIQVGDEITTIGGVLGKVVSIKDDTITMETGADRVKIRIARWAIQSKETKISD